MKLFTATTFTSLLLSLTVANALVVSDKLSDFPPEDVAELTELGYKDIDKRQLCNNPLTLRSGNIYCRDPH